METQEFTELVERTESKFRGYVTYKTGSPELAEDLTQDTYLKVWEKQKQFTGGNLDGWAFTILYRGMLDHIKKKRPSLTPNGEIYDRADETSVEDTVIGRDTVRQLKALEPQQQEILALAMTDHSGEQIADYFGIEYQAAMSRMWRARHAAGRLGLA